MKGSVQAQSKQSHWRKLHFEKKIEAGNSKNPLNFFFVFKKGLNEKGLKKIKSELKKFKEKKKIKSSGGNPAIIPLLIPHNPPKLAAYK